MIISTSTWARSNDPHEKLAQCLDVIKAAGFDYADANFWNLKNEDSPLCSDEWEAWANSVREHADEIGIKFHQAHALTLTGSKWDDLEYNAEHIWKTNHRAFEVAKIIGVKCMVMHPANLPHDTLYSAKRAKEFNFKYLAPFIDDAKRLGIQIAVENLVDFGGHRRRYCGGDPYELLDLVDSINDPSVGVCIDTGHANLACQKVGDMLRLFGKRVIAMHINDNYDGKDMHLIPFEGTVDWEDTVRAIREIGYTGAFSYEINDHRQREQDKVLWLRLYRDIARSLLGE